jgi:hypothetical protein
MVVNKNNNSSCSRSSSLRTILAGIRAQTNGFRPGLRHAKTQERGIIIFTRYILYMLIQYVYTDILTVLYSIVDKPLYTIYNTVFGISWQPPIPLIHTTAIVPRDFTHNSRYRSSQALDPSSNCLSLPHCNAHQSHPDLSTYCLRIYSQSSAWKRARTSFSSSSRYYPFITNIRGSRAP